MTGRPGPTAGIIAAGGTVSHEWEIQRDRIVQRLWCYVWKAPRLNNPHAIYIAGPFTAEAQAWQALRDWISTASGGAAGAPGLGDWGKVDPLWPYKHPDRGDETCAAADVSPLAAAEQLSKGAGSGGQIGKAARRFVLEALRNLLPTLEADWGEALERLRDRSGAAADELDEITHARNAQLCALISAIGEAL